MIRAPEVWTVLKQCGAEGWGVGVAGIMWCLLYNFAGVTAAWAGGAVDGGRGRHKGFLLLTQTEDGSLVRRQEVGRWSVGNHQVVQCWG